MRLATTFKTNRFRVPASWIAGILWCLAIAGIYYYFSAQGLHWHEILYGLFVFFSTDPRAPILYILIYTLQPFAFLPSTVFTILAGSVFGFWPALAYTLIGANFSASAVYGTGRVLAIPAPGLVDKLGSWVGPLLRSPFMTVLFMRLAYFPFDVVNFVSGILKLRYWPFVFATAIGSLPGIATITALGTSISLREFLENGISVTMVNPRLLLISLGLFLVSISIAEIVRRLQRRFSATPLPADAP